MRKHWSVDEEKFKKEYPEKYRFWRLAFDINYGLERGEKLDKEEIKKAWPKIKNELDPYRKRLLKYLIWGKVYSLPPNITFWNWPQKKNQ